MTHFSNINIISFKDQISWVFLANIIWSFVITSGSQFEYFLGSEGFSFFSSNYFLTMPAFLFWIYYFFAFAGLVYGIVSVAKKIRSYFFGNPTKLKDQALILFLLVYIFIQLSYLIFKVPAFPHYNIIFYPIITVFTVLFMQACFDKAGFILKRSIPFIVISIIISNLYFTGAFYSFISKHPNKIKGDYGLPYFLTKNEWRKTLP